MLRTSRRLRRRSPNDPPGFAAVRADLSISLTAPTRYDGGVAPSRGRGSKLGHLNDRPEKPVSPPHGGADRNRAALAAEAEAGRRPLTGARIETLLPLRFRWLCPRVAPSRGRGSKHGRGRRELSRPASPPHGGADRNRSARSGGASGSCRPLTGARIETRQAACRRRSCSGRPLTGARIETRARDHARRPEAVAPSRGRGSKP